MAQIEFPSVLLPNDIASGSIVDITVARNHAAEDTSAAGFHSLQKRILNNYGINSPSPPVLRLRNATQTSLVLEWDPIDLATASLKSLSLYRNGSKAGSIPRPFETRSTKISGLAIHTEYTFHLVLRTTAGTYQSEKLTCRTHKMTDLSGITVTPGVLPPQQKEALASALDRIGGKMIDTVRIDTTHFVCTEGRGPLWEKAVEMNIPVVVPEWVDACESEGTIVSVRGYYLNADPKNRQLGPIQSTTHQRTTSTVSAAPPQFAGDSRRPSHAPERDQPAGEPPTTPFPGGPTSGQPTTEEREVSDDEQSPPPPPPKDETAEPEQKTPQEQPEQNGEPKPVEDGLPSEDQKEEGEKERDEEPGPEPEKESTSQQEEKAEGQDQPSNNGENKGKGKESEGDSFNEVPL